MDEQPYGLWFDPNAVGADLVARCWISHGPRADDDRFDPHPGDRVTVGDSLAVTAPVRTDDTDRKP